MSGPNMPSSLRTDFPVISVFPRRLSAATPALARISEQPRQQKSVLKCSTATARKMSPLNPNYTFFDTASDTSSSVVSSKAFLPLANVPSCLSVENLGFEDASDNDWSTGWDIDSSSDENGHKADLPNLPVIRDGDFAHYPGHRANVPDLPVNRNGDFAYYPKTESRWSGDVSDESLKLARKRMERRRSEIENTKGFKGFLTALLKRLGLVGRR
jgi:hypothetical protein